MSTPRPNAERQPEPAKERLATAETHFAPDEAVATAEAAEAAAAMIGRVVDGRYRIVRSLGEGGMGAVYIAEHLKLGSEVALKVIRPELMKNEEIAARFAREAMASARLNHPHVASALDYGTLPEGGAYLVMQLARGMSLSSYLEVRGALPWPVAAEIAAQVADAAAAAHALGIVHRDLKPDNVFVEERDGGSVLCQVLDFGIARVQVAGESSNDAAAPGRALTTIGTIMGTPGYMAPEQAMGQAADARADLYALGVMLAEMISGQPLFDGDTFTSIVTAQLTKGAPTVAERATALRLPGELESLLAALVAPEVAMRPASAGEVRDTLRRIVRAYDDGAPRVWRTGELPVARPPAASPTTATPFGIGAAPPVPQGPSALHRLHAGLPAPLRRVPLRAWAATAAALAIAAVLAMASARDDQGASHAEGAATSVALPERVLPIVPAPLQPLVQVAQAVRGNEVDRDYAVLLESEDHDAREAAAERIAARPASADVPPVARAAADLEIARSCRDRLAAVQRLGEIGDASVLPALERLAATPRRGCGFLNSKDCNRCLRKGLDEVIAGLRGAGGR